LQNCADENPPIFQSSTSFSYWM